MKIEYVNPRDLIQDPNQPRTHMDKKTIEALAQSYETFPEKVIDPIEIDKNNVIVRGHRRREAALIAKLDKVPVHRIEDVDKDRQQRLLRQLIEAEDYSPMDRAWSYATAIININQSEKQYTIPEVKQMDRVHLTTLLDAQTGGAGGTKKQGQSELSRKIGVPQTTISMYLRTLLVLEPETQQMIEEGELPVTLGDELTRIKSLKTKLMVESLIRDKKPQRDVVRRFVTLLKDKEDIKMEVVEKIFSMKTKDAKKYLDSLEKVTPDLQEKVIESDLETEDIEKLGEFEEPEQQEEILDLYEQKSEEDDELFEDVVDKYKDIAKGEKPPEIEEELSPELKRFNRINEQCDKFIVITPATIKKIPEGKQRDTILDKLQQTENHIHKLLETFDVYKTVG